MNRHRYLECISAFMKEEDIKKGHYINMSESVSRDVLVPRRLALDEPLMHQISRLNVSLCF